MLEARNVSLQFGKRVLFDDVNIKFHGDSCYGVIGANGAGKSTFLKILTDEITPVTGQVHLESGKRMAVLNQNHSEFNETTALHTVMMGHKVLWKIMQEKDAVYAKPDFSEADGMRASVLEGEFAEMDGWNAESTAASLLSGLGIDEKEHDTLLKDLSGNEKVRILLAQALFGNPDVLILDEPTNDLDIRTISWLEDFLLEFRNTVIVVSHDRHFLDTVCTNIVDIDFKKLNSYTGNYSFWYESSQLALKQRTTSNKKAEAKKKELQEFIQRFSANASKSKQATSRKKLLEKINLDDIQPSSRKYPAVIFTQLRDAGNQLLELDQLSAKRGDEVLFDKLSLQLNKGDKIAFLSKSGLAITTLFQILEGEAKASRGEFRFGQTISTGYLPNESGEFFKTKESLIDWLREYSPGEKDDVFIRGFLGKMLFTGEESLKGVNVLSGGEKVRCMLSRMMLAQGNLLILDEPTNHLDLESIQALNNALQDFPGTVMFTSHDHTFTQTIANRIIEIGPNGYIDKELSYDEYNADDRFAEQRAALYN
jgi:ATPase subunit of ABC transporter with duplicated ATPase domains|tara:strand:- start:1656 stop:3272 length:1617 start_codon:yes stop_codon:yes gene_type:complete